MSFLAGLFQLLSTSPTLVAIQAARVFPVLLPENMQLPATTYHSVGGRQRPTLGGPGPQRRRVQLDFRAVSAAAADELRDATIAVLNGFHGPMPNGFVVLGCWLIQPLDYFDSDARQFRCADEFYFDFVTQGA